MDKRSGGQRSGRKPKNSKSTTPTVNPEATGEVRECPTCRGAGQIVDQRNRLLYEDLKDIAHDAQVSESQLSRMLSRNPRTKRGTHLRTAIRIARRMGLTLDELAGIVCPEEA